jgi:hypothetical protein
MCVYVGYNVTLTASIYDSLGAVTDTTKLVCSVCVNVVYVVYVMYVMYVCYVFVCVCGL